MRAHVETTVHVGDSADLEPLLAAMADDSWCVLLVNRVHARILRGDRDRLRLVKKWSDPLPKRTEQGGWSQPQYQRHVDEGAKEHVRGACEAVFHELLRAPFDALAVVTTDELWAEVESGLHADLQRHLVGRVNADVEHSSEDEVLRAAGGVIEETERRREAAVLQELSDQMGAADRGATGLRDVLEALYGKRVDTLIVGRDFEAAGRVCASCGWIGVEGATCPSEGTPTAERADVVPDAIDAAIQQSADVVVLRHSSYEADGGPIAAILRY
jgi:peptide subunit release factor 1 (eRF1)